MADLETSFSGGSIRGTVRDGFGNVDKVTDIEGVQGTLRNDRFTGSRADNLFFGGEGRDSYDGQGGSDTLDFRAYFDSAPPGGIQVNLGRTDDQVVDDGFGNSERALRIENVIGTNQADTIRGNAAANGIEGRRGKDVLSGGAGADTFVWRMEAELGQNDRITDFGAADRLSFEIDGFRGMTENLVLVNGTMPNSTAGTFLFDAARDTLFWDRNGTVTGGRTAVVTLVGVGALTDANFDLG